MPFMHAPNDLNASNQSSGLMQIENVEAASELDNFIYIVSHDLRNSARALTEVPQWLRDDLKDQDVTLSVDAEENFELLERHAKRLDRMLLDLLVYSRIGRLQEVSEFDLNDLVDRVIAECNLPSHLTVDVRRPLPSVRLGYKDAFVLFKCILDNVIVHAHGEATTVTISGKRKKDTVTLTVTDTGPGISDRDVQRAFRPMTTLRRRDEVEGSGMGLAIVHRIAQYYRGELWAGGNPDGRGFRLRIRLRDSLNS